MVGGAAVRASRRRERDGMAPGHGKPGAVPGRDWRAQSGRTAPVRDKTFASSSWCSGETWLNVRPGAYAGSSQPPQCGGDGASATGTTGGELSLLKFEGRAMAPVSARACMAGIGFVMVRLDGCSTKLESERLKRDEDGGAQGDGVHPVCRDDRNRGLGPI